MYARVGLAAVAAVMMMLAPTAFAQSGRGEARVRTCAGDCAEERADAMRELAKARAEMERLARLLADRGDSLDTRQLARARSQLVDAITRIERLERRAREQQIEAREARVMIARVPPSSAGRTIAREGWLGVSFSSAFEEIESPGEPRLVRFLQYPTVEAVEPASPARRAGIEVGDVLLAFDGKDLRSEPIALDVLLTPGKRMPVTLRRDGDRRTLVVVVGERPRGTYTLMPTPAPPAVPPRATPRVPSGRVSVVPAPPAPSEAATARIWAYPLTSESLSLAGAQMAVLPSELREQLGAEGGLLVLRVAHGTPASRAGLQNGDVIVAAGGADVRSSGDLLKAFRAADDRAVSLRVVRKREPVTVRMSW